WFVFGFFFFFFSSRRRHTRFDCDWSSTCALPIFAIPLEPPPPRSERFGIMQAQNFDVGDPEPHLLDGRQDFGKGRHVTARENVRSEERRVGKECRERRAPRREEKKEERGGRQSGR